MAERDAERSKQRILSAAEYEFSEKGYFGARVDEIAAKAEINKRMIYAYFKDKENLYQQVLSQVYLRMEVEEQVLIDNRYKGVELIRQIVSSYFSFLQNNPTVVRILMWENLNQGKYLTAIENSRIERNTIQYFVSSLEEGKREGIFRSDIDSWHTALSLITTCFANFSNQYTLSKLFHADLFDETMVEQRKQHTIQLMVAYLCNKKQGGTLNE